MARRNMEEITEQTEIPRGYDLKISEIEKLLAKVESGRIVSAIEIAFKYGFVLGSRATMAQIKRKRRGTNNV